MSFTVYYPSEKYYKIICNQNKFLKKYFDCKTIDFNKFVNNNYLFKKIQILVNSK